MPETQFRTLQELTGRMEYIRSELSTLDENADLSEEQLSWQGTIIAEYDELEKKAAPLRKRMADIDRVRSAAAQPENREEPESVDAPVRGRQAPNFTRSRDVFEDMDRVRNNLVAPDELRARAATLIEQDASGWDMDDSRAEAATVRSQSSVGTSKHILLTGSQEYRQAFRSYLETGDGDRYRAILLSNASGGYLLPYVLDPTIVLTNNASANPFRRVSRVVTTTSNAWQGVSSAGVNAAWVLEATTAADAAPSDFAQIQIKPQKAAAWVLGSYEALDDENFGVQLPGLLSDAKDRLESAAFATGTGTNQPLGIATAMVAGNRVAPTTTGTAFNGTAAIPDIGNLMAALPPRFRRSTSAAFMANIVQLNKVRSMDQYGGGGFWANLTSDTPPSLYGSPVYEGSDLNSGTTGTSAASGTGSQTLYFGDWNQFIIADRVGVSMLYDPLIKGTGASAQLPAGEAGWYMFWRVSSAVSTTAGFRVLTIS
jgi:HK97 family phage major capsid protein